MTEKDKREKELKERYIYQVIRRVPKAQREEIKMELNELIEDMCEHSSMEQVLEKLGNPEEFAKQYRGEEHFVIGPKYYDNYIWVLKIVMISVLASGIVSAIFNGITGQNWSAGTVSAIVNGTVDIAIELITETVSNLMIGGLAGFGGVTLIFACMERQNMKINVKQKQERPWTPEQLTPVPEKKALISRGDSVVGLVFIMLCSGIFLFAPELIGAYVFEKGELVRTIPVFNMEKWNIILPFLLISLGIGLIDEMVRLVAGCYCKMVMISNIIAGILQSILGIIVLKVLPFWNESFTREMEEVFGKGFTSKGDLLHYWGTDVISNVVLALVLLITFIEMGVTVYKTLRYGTKEKAQ